MMQIYVIDSSSLINLLQHVPMDVFPSVWRKLESKIEDRQLIAPKEVLNEIRQKDDDLLEWAKKHLGVFVEDSTELADLASELARENPNAAKSKQRGEADLWVIALARLKSEGSLATPVIVTQEKRRGHQIPRISEKYGIDSIGILDMFRRENWKF